MHDLRLRQEMRRLRQRQDEDFETLMLALATQESISGIETSVASLQTSVGSLQTSVKGIETAWVKYRAGNAEILDRIEERLDELEGQSPPAA